MSSWNNPPPLQKVLIDWRPRIAVALDCDRLDTRRKKIADRRGPISRGAAAKICLKNVCEIACDNNKKIQYANLTSILCWCPQQLETGRKTLEW